MPQEQGGGGRRVPGQTADDGPPPSQVDRGWEDAGATQERPTELAPGFEGFELVDAGAGITGGREAYPFATAEDFEDDTGDWTPEDYASTAQVLFGGSEGFGESALERWRAEGFELLPNNDAYRASIAKHVPELTAAVSFFAGDPVVALGFARLEVVRRLQQVFPTIDWSRVHVTLGEHARPPRDKPLLLPAGLRSIQPSETADLRTPSTSVGDQQQTGRSAAFAWTHAMQMAGPVFGVPIPRLSCSFAMMQLQRRQGDYVDHAGAWAGGQGARAESEPHTTFAQLGTCRQEMWPDESPEPCATDDQMARDAQRFKLPARVVPLALSDVKKVLTAGCPVVVTMMVGPAFAEVGRDGILPATGWPSREHGYHCLLIVGYVGNFFILKNCWGEDWGDGGYCYVPRPVLKRSEPYLQAVVWDQQLLVHPGPDRPFGFDVEESASPPASEDLANARTEPPPADLMPDFQTVPSSPVFAQTASGLQPGPPAELFGAPPVAAPWSMQRPPEVTPPLSRLVPAAATVQSARQPAASAAGHKSGTAPGYAQLPLQVAALIEQQAPVVSAVQPPSVALVQAPLVSLAQPPMPPSVAAPQVPSVRAAVSCPKCGRMTAGRFCEGCGSPMIAVAKFCRQCGAKVRQGAKFCTQCASPAE